MNDLMVRDRDAPMVDRELQSLAAALDDVTAERLGSIGVRPGWRCLEIGAGNGSVARLLADLVGPAGHVDATDIDVSRLASVMPPNTTVKRHDITVDRLLDIAYDLVHVRLVLTHLPARRAVLDRLWRSLRPGGWLLTEDYDRQLLAPPLMSPDDEAARLYHRVMILVAQVMTRAGADTGWGTRAYAAFREVGLTDVTAQTHSQSAGAGSPASELLNVIVAQLRTPLLDTGLVTHSELDRFARLLDNPRFAHATPLFVSTWGRRPAYDTT